MKQIIQLAIDLKNKLDWNEMSPYPYELNETEEIYDSLVQIIAEVHDLDIARLSLDKLMLDQYNND
tara:strand:- start:1599 stop:1796 length:198 start_codon:yes stop_codon:yes gene_type:complete